MLPVYTVAFWIVGQCGVPNPAYPGPDWKDVAFATSGWTNDTVYITEATLDLNIIGYDYNQFGEITAFAGNSQTPDVITNIRSAVETAPNSGLIHFSSTDTLGDGYNTGMPFKGTVGVNPQQTYHIDVHVDCMPLLSSYQGYLTIRYTIPNPGQ